MASRGSELSREGTRARRSAPWSRYVAMGDSFTAGVGDPEPLSPGGMRGWADRVAEELGEGRGDFGYANLAISGLVMRDILEQQLGPALNLKPDLVTLSAGGNDILFHRGDPDRLVATLDDAVAALSATGATVVLFTGPDWGETAVLGTSGKGRGFQRKHPRHRRPAQQRHRRLVGAAATDRSANVGSGPSPLLAAGTPHHCRHGPGHPQHAAPPAAAGAPVPCRPETGGKPGPETWPGWPITCCPGW